MIIDVSDFINRPYKVPNQEESRDFSSFLESGESGLAAGNYPQIKCSLLGVDLWDEFTSALAASGELDEKWVRLRDGATYEYSNKTYQYLGWADLIRPALYSEWLPNIAFKNTNVGVINNKAPQQA